MSGRAGNYVMTIALAVLLGLGGAVRSETVFHKSTSYFKISGKTAEDLDRELSRRGPMARSTGNRHPGATQISFAGSVTYFHNGRRCAVHQARVILTTKIILPRWTNRKRAGRDMALIWDTLSADIKRHEERHAEIARTHARLMESSLLSLGTASNCAIMKDRVARASAKSVAAHQADQRRFDRVEAANFEDRIIRLLRNRVEGQAAK